MNFPTLNLSNHKTFSGWEGKQKFNQNTKTPKHQNLILIFVCISKLIVEDIEDGLLREHGGDVSLCDKEGVPRACGW